MTEDATDMETQEDRHITAHHEAAHALAAVSLGREVYEIHSVWPGGSTSHEPPDSMFVIHAGPWASARLRRDEDFVAADDLAFMEEWAEQFKINTDDWAAHLRLEGSATTETDLQAALFFHDRELPPLPTSNPEWHATMEGLWNEIQCLATDILADAGDIEVGQTLKQVKPEPRLWRKEGWLPDQD